jgi:predicted Zn finger-like uncharacterized protein
MATASELSGLMIITCPHCQTRYQVAFEAIGSAGRKVQCANCQQAWSQRPVDPDAIWDEDPQVRSIDEDALDDALVSEARAVQAAQSSDIEKPDESETKEPAKIDPVLARKRQRAFSQRQSAMASQLPLAKLQRAARISGAVLLAGVLLGGYFGRVGVVEQFPAMAGVYAAIGMPVNVIGLEFDRLETLRALREGKEILTVSAQIVGIEKAPVKVPAVVVTLVDANGKGIYEWSVTPDVSDMMAGERATFETQLPLPPAEAASVRLSFAGGDAARSGPANAGAH